MDCYPAPSIHLLYQHRPWLASGLPPLGACTQHSSAQQAGPLLWHKASGVQIHINPILARPLHCPKGSDHIFQRDIKLPWDQGACF